MSETTPHLRLPYLAAAQAQKHVTHNEAIRALDALVQLAVLDRDLTAPPSSPANGDRYIVASPASGAWAGQDGNVAAYQDGAWAFFAPQEGWLVWVADEDELVAWDGSSWIAAGGSDVNPTPLVGVNATADATNRLSVASPATLFNHEGAGHQHKINKNADTDTASLLFQTGFSGRAEFGTAGDDDFHVKVSSDGSTWHEALVADRASGVIKLRPFTVATLPAATAGRIAFVTDAPGGPVFAYADGTDWRRCSDGARISLFTPASLSSLEAWYDPSDLSTLWQDTGGTIAVTADSQPVARIDDKSGNANHLIQSTASQRPLYRTGSGKHWLSFDGTDDYLELTTAIALGSTFTIALALDSVTLSSNGLMPIGGGLVSGGPNHRGYLWFDPANTKTLLRVDSEALGVDVPGDTIVGDGLAHVVTVNRSAATDIALRDNASELATTTSSSSNSLTLRTVGTSYNFSPYTDPHELYGLVVRSASSAGQDLSDLEQYLADKVGATLP